MKIGLFIRASSGWLIMSEAAPQYRPDFEYNKEVVQKAERYGMDFALSLVKYQGFGGKTDHWHWALDSFTTIAGLAAVTDRIKLIGSVGLQAHHPAVAARHAAMIQQISHGRFWLNVVTGWQKSEYASLGLWRGDEHYASRYDYADEYITICRELWETGESSFKGSYFELDGAQLEPRPQEPIKVVCAASSRPRPALHRRERRLQLHLRHERRRAARDQPADPRGRGQGGPEIKSIASIHCIMGDTDEEAAARVQRYYDGADLEALAHMSGQAEFDAAGTTSQIIQNLRIATFMGAEVLTGTPETIAEKLAAYEDVEGLEGLMVCLDDPRREIDRFGEQVLPLLGSGRNGLAVGRDHRAPGERAVAHALVGVGDALEREALDVRVDVARSGQLEDLGQLDGAAPVRVGDARVEAHACRTVIGSVPPATPMTMTEPRPWRPTWTSSASVASLPTQSSTSVAPRPPVSSRISRGRVLAGLRPWRSRRRSRASASFAGSTSTAITLAGVSARRIWTAMWPRPPTPITTALVPGRAWCSASLIAW